MEQIIIVDKNDNPIGSKLRDQITKDDIYRISSCWIKNSKNQVLIAQRSFDKTHDPGKYGPACAGTNAVGETYESNAKKELEEELRLKDVELVKGPKAYNDRDWKLFCQWFFVNVDKSAEDFVIQEEEVVEVKWIDEDELLKRVREKPEEFVGAMQDVIRDLYPISQPVG